MLPTRTTVALFAVTLLVLPVAAFFSSVRWLLVGYDASLFGLFCLDALLAYRSSGLEVKRQRSGRLSIGIQNEVVLLLDNPTGRWQRVLVRDEVPDTFQVEPPILEAQVAPHGWARLRYQVFPTERGNFDFGDHFLRCQGPLRLAWVDRTIRAGETVQVFPNLLEVRRYEALMRTTLVRAGGYHTRRWPGAGREFSHFRDYAVDDDYRHVSWKATARRGKPTTAVFESEHSQDVIFCLDAGRMMAARVGLLSKLDHAINAVLMLTHVSQAFQDNLGLLVFTHSVHQYLPPAKGRAQHAHFLQALYSVKPELCYVNYREAFQYLIARRPKRALVLVFTDLLDRVVSAEYRDAARLLQRFHLPLTLAVADVPLQKLAERSPQTVDELYDIGVARDLLHGRRELLRSLEREGMPVLDTVPERLTIDAVNRYLALKTGSRL